MKNRYLLGIALSSGFGLAMENDFYISPILKNVKKHFYLDYNSLENSLKKNPMKKALLYRISVVNKGDKSMLIHSAVTGYFGGVHFDCIRLTQKVNSLDQNNMIELKEYIPFKLYALPVLTTLKAWSKKHSLKVPKPLIEIILNYGYPKYQFEHDQRGLNFHICNTIRQRFSLHSPNMFVDKYINIVINFKDERDNNILYIQTEDKLERLVVPKKIHDGEFLRVNSKICTKGTISDVFIEKNKLHLKKDGHEYSVQL